VVVSAAQVDLDAGDALLDELAGQQAAHAEAVPLAAVHVDDVLRLLAYLEDRPQWRDGKVESLLVDGLVRLGGATERLAGGCLLLVVLAIDGGEGALGEVLFHLVEEALPAAEPVHLLGVVAQVLRGTNIGGRLAGVLYAERRVERTEEA